ncbi:iron complex transport system substrate-binding protein [Sinobacterium caligoides]|uniref:Iron complex transport system substrate-binding protein n=1 Tax=Sinobacterium caligoides TaxID=933926 RepID=A0A3N2DK21_9GAMM|nr:iron-siderophore ABC transporter substrate-binding protein [Sinobacterium caligoides]ROS00150.1 iron complex transport system substrate-binding protein [Sinobacterium caligoides]
MLRQAFISLLLVCLSLSSWAEIQVHDSRGPQKLPALPERVAVLNWDLAEQVIELGVTPIAMPEINAYKEWVIQPTVPKGVQDIGSRIEPNFQLLAQLHPDLIIIASPQLDLLERLEKIAPVLYYHTYSATHDNAATAISNFQHIAAALGRSEVAEKRLTEMRQRLAELKQQLLTAYGGKLPKVSTFRFASTTSVYLFGDNSMAQYALSQLGISPALHLPATQWGATQQRLMALRDIGDATALYFTPFAQQQALEKTILWQAMPFVRQHRVHAVAPVWNYGGAISIQYLAEALAESLLAIAPQPTKTSNDANKTPE